MLDKYIDWRYIYITGDDISPSVIMEVILVGESTERGALTEAVFYILLSLYTPMHGYGIMQNVRELSKDRVNLGPGTLYGAINTLLEKSWIKPVEGNKESRKKEYEITESGKSAVNEEIIRLEELIENGRKITGGGF
jgi:DNA-binding PadR family transcriptional regulator